MAYPSAEKFLYFRADLARRAHGGWLVVVAVVQMLSGCLDSNGGSAPATVVVPHYRATRIAPSIPVVVANAINNSGQVAGYFLNSDGARHPFLYSNGTMTDLCLPGCQDGVAQGINDAGQVVGQADGHAFLYSAGTIIDLGTLGGPQSTAYGINDSGQIVGESDTAQSTPLITVRHAFLHSGGTMVDLGTLGGSGSSAHGINTGGAITGWAQTAGGDTHAFVYSGGSMIDLGTPGVDSIGYGINVNGDVTGRTFDSAVSAIGHAFLYSGGPMVDLGPVSIGYGINKRRQIVGFGETELGNSAFLYSDGHYFALNALITEGLDAVKVNIGTAINGSGQIAGYSCTGIAQLPGCAAWRLDPIP